MKHTPENPRMLLAAFIDGYLSRPGALATFLDRVSKALGQVEASYRNFVWNVRAGHRAIPEPDRKTWARCLGLLPDTPEWDQFIQLAEAADAYGKVGGRKHLARVDAQLAEAEADKARLEKALARSEAKLADAVDRIGMLEALLLKRGKP